ncbi:hypothetical protein LHV56_19070 [Peribacillus frigoritolerans]|uniref:hypothetical protein n=1 Tax=Peribacillus frigoritolerans TaxID=450367 RepID=UPI0020794FD3|nr:hypothetical protein [Peribacillus frigoritolerans]USK78935.1 hypothetical protein LHV56_19070 [Peribacillus frigoritolerans]
MKKDFNFSFRKSEEGKTAEEIIQTLVDTTIKKVLTEYQNKYYNSLKEYTS